MTKTAVEARIGSVLERPGAYAPSGRSRGLRPKLMLPRSRSPAFQTAAGSLRPELVSDPKKPHGRIGKQLLDTNTAIAAITTTTTLAATAAASTTHIRTSTRIDVPSIRHTIVYTSFQLEA